jgi:uncharacterized protein (TIGR03067 family)
MRRLTLTLTALALTAFAPVPRPRPCNARTAIDLERFQGTWEVLGFCGWDRGVQARSDTVITHIRVQKDNWTLLGDGVSVTYRIELDPSKRPCHITWRGERGEPLWLGLIRRDGDAVDVIFRTATRSPAPTCGR